MKQSHLFTKTRRESPKDEVSKNADLLIRAGYIHKDMAGVYSFLPLGLRTLNNIVEVIREEMNTIGGQEVSLTALQDKAIWEKTDRWSDKNVDIWFKTEFKNGTETGLAITHEEPLTAIMTDYISSYRDLPKSVYQFQTKFRNETRAKSGIMRGKEFLMKDLYSFARDKTQHDELYAKAREAYIRIFGRLGLGLQTYPTFASGGIFSEFSEEFQTVSEAGEDVIYVHEDKHIALNKEVFNDAVLAKLGLKKEELIEKKSIEVGNIFTLGTKFSEPLGLSFADESGVRQPVYMGSYGIGPSRVMGTIVEVLSDEKGIVWPEAIAPFKVHILSLQPQSEKVKELADSLYEKCQKLGISALYDERDVRPGEKLSDSELLGLPHIIVIGEKGLADGIVEYKLRKDLETKRITIAEINSVIEKLV